MPYKDPHSQAAKDSNKRRMQRYMLKHPEKVRKQRKEANCKLADTGYFLFYRTGITLEEWNNKLKEQNYLCKLCNLPLNLNKDCPKAESPVVDHNHACCSGKRSCGSCYRGIIHHKCNVGLGMFSDDSVLLRLAIEYLEKNNEHKS